MDTFLRVVLHKPWSVLVVTVVVTMLIGIGLKDARLSSDFRLYFSDENPQMLAFEVLEADFNKQDNLVFLVTTEEGVFHKGTLTFLKKLVDEAWKLPFARRVDGITNFPRTISTDDELASDYLVPDGFEFSESALDEIRMFARNDVSASQYFSEDESVAVVTVSLSLPDDPKATEIVVKAARELISDDRFVPPGLKIQLIGTAIINLALQEAVERDTSLLIPISYVVIFAAMYFLIRVMSGVFITIAVISLSNVAVFGGFILLGGTITPGVGAVPSMVMIIAVADCMHLLVSYYHYLRTQDKLEALRNAMKINFKPMFVTSVTTAVGLLCLNFSESPPYRDLGNMVAFGAIYAFLLTITFVPSLLIVMPVPRKITKNLEPYAYEKWVENLGQWVSSYPIRLVVVSTIFVVIAISQVPRNELTDNWENNYDETFPVKQALKVQEKKLSGTRFIEYKVYSGESGGIFSPLYMKDLDNLVGWLREQPEVGGVIAFSDQVKQINETLHANDNDYYTIPDGRDLVAQIILLYEMSLPFGMGIEERVDIDKSSTRLSVQLYSLSSKEIIAFDSRVLEWVENNTKGIEVSEGTGLDIVFAHISQRNIESMVVGTVVALVLISVILIFMLRSLKLGLISLIPNLVPAAMAYGVWGVLVGRIDLAVSIVGTMSLGLVVDDTVHFLSKYRYARSELGADVYKAIEFAFKTVGMAMLVTSVVLALGFGLLFISHFGPTWSMGSLLAITIVFALIVDFFLLPGCLVLFDKDEYTDMGCEENAK